MTHDESFVTDKSEEKEKNIDNSNTALTEKERSALKYTEADFERILENKSGRKVLKELKEELVRQIKQDQDNAKKKIKANKDNQTSEAYTNDKEHNETVETILREQDKLHITDLEKQFVMPTPTGIEKGYDNSSFHNEVPDTTTLMGAPYVNKYNANGVFIGSTPITYPYNYFSELDDTEGQCEEWNLCLPNLNIPESILDFLDKLNKNSVSSKTIEAINKLADEVDKVATAKILVQIISDNYHSVSEALKSRLEPRLIKRIEEYSLTPISDRIEEYSDLSAYLNAPFPKLELSKAKDSKELDKVLKELEGLSLEELKIPDIDPNITDVTEKTLNGNGAFDYLATSIKNQLLGMKQEQLITNAQLGDIYATSLVQAIQTATQYALEKHNIVIQGFQAKANALQASVAMLEAKTKLLLLPSQLRLAYAQIEAQLEQIELLKVQTQIEKAKYPQIVAQTDLLLAQTDSQRLANEQTQVGIQQGKLSLVLTQEQIEQSKEQTKLLKEQIVQAELSTEDASLKLEHTKEQTKSLVINNNRAIEEVKLIDAQTQHQLKQVELADIGKIEAKARIKMYAQQLEKEKENLGLVKAQVASAMAQLALIKDQRKASKAQISDTINGKPVGGLIGAQILVNKVQASSFERRAFSEMVQQLQTGWATNKTADIAMSSPASFTPMTVDRVLHWGMTKYFNLPNDVLQLPVGYTPYLSDEQMDGEEPVTYKVRNNE